MDSVTLRKTHFILGDHRSNYSTTLQEQNKYVKPEGIPVVGLNADLKNDLRKSHFNLGNHKTSFVSCTKADYVPKKSNVEIKDLSDVGKSLRKHSHVLGNNLVDYKSEMQSKFQNPLTSGKQKQVVSTAELQKSHYSFGSSNPSWSTTTNSSYGVKVNPDLKLYSKNLTKTNFILGDDHMPNKSIFHETFVPHPVSSFNQANKDLSQDLHAHHFKFGNDKPVMSALSHMDYIPRSSENSRFAQTIDHNTLKKSHFSIGDKSQPSNDHFESIYTKSMTHKEIDKNEKLPNNSFKSSLTLKGKDNNSYTTEFKAK